ncbi:hypothetical protein BDV27DRAFT_120571 [Aspergillus caelatus]|uniref:SUN domain-containing protein n=1 Tax=Aspergillus caelatus TaxID=61420 RepID=A0A5N7AIA6_9EURO|nr:uncharacterized protein BDV27DRAFT_120571 [Aspergillus caelatus]KAE8369604.1 hypothetical protein BDV27DRAFT_120571 [Aspergillus caelatus]
MPPKRASTRRAGAVTRTSDRGTPSYIPSMSSPDARNPALPDIPTKQSFAYGSSTTPILPRELAAKPRMNLVEMASNIDEGRRVAQDRDFDRPHMNTRSRRQSVSASLSPVRRSRREPTPDQLQLLDSLREATMSPNPNGQDHAEQSTPTPTPPIPHTLSTASSPATESLTNPKYPVLTTDQLYPSPLLRYGSPARNAVSLSSPNFATSIDNESVISWNVERDIHEDNLQRTRPNGYLDGSHGKNITAPPRRFSGFAFAQEPIEEVDEPTTQLSISKSRSPEAATADIQPKPEPLSESEMVPSPESTPSPEPEPEPEREREREREPTPPRAPTPASRISSKAELSSAPTRTIIPSNPIRETSFDESTYESTSPLRERVKSNVRSVGNAAIGFQKGLPIRAIILAVLTAAFIFTACFFGDQISRISSGIGSRLPLYGGPFRDLNATALQAVHGLSNQVVRLGEEVSSLSKEVDVIKSEVEHIPVPSTIVQPIPAQQETPKINFLSIGMGVLVDPYNTSPTSGRSAGFLQKLQSQFWSGDLQPQPEPPLAALTPWQDVGECWCSKPRSGMSQLALHLGRDIVPEEVVVEHIPKGASIRPEVAPRDMELWAQFQIVDESNPDSSSYPPIPPRKSGMLSEQSSLHDHIIDTLRLAYKGEAEGAYSNDELLGPSFYRVGQWTYDLNSSNHIQKFELDAIIDVPAIRVNKVAFRVKSNWGGNDTCLYRLKLYGHI